MNTRTPDHVPPCEIAVVGAAGFVGQHLLTALHSHPGIRVRVLVHRTPPASVTANITPIAGDLLNADSLNALVAPGGVVINLAYLSGTDARNRNRQALTNLCETCAAVGAARLVHCSTAVVVGRSANSRIDESTPCNPTTEYERLKLDLEQIVFERGRGRFEVAVLRPSAIVGPGGKNLAKLVHSLRRGPRLVNYARSSLFGNRSLNLVHVENVVAALIFLATTRQAVDGEVYLVSDDDSRENQFRTAERLLMETLGIPDYALPPLPIPGWLLSGVLRVAGRSNTDPHRTYDDSKLMRLGFRKLAKLRDGIREFVLAEATYDAASMRGRATTSPEGVGSA